MFDNFIIGVASSLSAALILLTLGGMKSKVMRRILTAAAAAFLGVEVQYVFRNSRESEPVLQDSLERSRVSRILAGRGNAFQRETYNPVLAPAKGTARTVRILLPHPNSSRGTNWIDQRETELRSFDKAFGNGMLRGQIRSTISFLLPFVNPPAFEVRLYDVPHIGRIILTDDSLFLTPYKADRHARDCPVVHYGRGHTYDMYSRLFELVWIDSVPVQPSKADSLLK